MAKFEIIDDEISDFNSFSFTCPNCGHEIEISLDSDVVTCPNCNYQFELDHEND